MLKKLLGKLNNVYILSLAGNGAPIFLNLLGAFILFSWLSIEEFGIYAFFQAVFVLIDSSRTGFLQTPLIKFYAGADKERGRQIIGTTWYLGFIITGISFLTILPILFFPEYIRRVEITMAMQWFSITFLFTLPIILATWVQQAEMRFDRMLLIKLVNQSSYILCLVYFIFSGKKGVQYVFIANLSGCGITSLLVLIKGWGHFSAIKYKTQSWAKEIFHFGKYSFGTTISANLFRASDTFIISSMLGTAALAVYSLAQKLMEFIEFPLRSFIDTGVPALSAAYNKNKETVGPVMKKYAGMLTIALVPVALGGIIFADLAVSIISRGKYSGTEAANVFRIFMCFALLFPLDRFMGVTLDVMHQPKANLIKVLLMLIVNVIGDFIGIYFFNNVYGVALASIPTFMVGVVFGYWSLKKHLDFTVSEVFKLGYSECRLLIGQYIKK